MTMPKQKPGKSKQDYGTPADFLGAIQERFGFIDVDLAAHADNKKASRYLGPGSELGEDSLAIPWEVIMPTIGATWFLNPPFGKITPWARKCAEITPALRTWSARLLFLVPAAVGSNWFAKYVHGTALVLVTSPRLQFDGCPINPETGKVDGYIKDCMLCVFGETPGFETWRWKK